MREQEPTPDPANINKKKFSPDLIRMDERCFELQEMGSELYLGERKIESYWWSGEDGAPRTHLDPAFHHIGGSPIVYLSMRGQLFVEEVSDRTDSDLTLSSVARWNSDDPIPADRIDEIEGMDAGIAVMGSVRALVDEQGLLISPPVRSIEHLGSGQFRATGDRSEGIIQIISDEEKKEILNLKERVGIIRNTLFKEGGAEESLKLQKAIAEGLLIDRGIDDWSGYNTLNSIHVDYSIGGTRRSIQAVGSMHEFVSYKEEPGIAEYQQMHEAYYALRSEAVQFGFTERFLDTGRSPLPEGIIDTLIEDYDGYTAEKRAFIQRIRAFNERYGYRKVTIESKHSLWAIDAGISILGLEDSEAAEIVESLNPNQGKDSIKIIAPGVLVHKVNGKATTHTIGPDGIRAA